MEARHRNLPCRLLPCILLLLWMGWAEAGARAAPGERTAATGADTADTGDATQPATRPAREPPSPGESRPTARAKASEVGPGLDTPTARRATTGRPAAAPPPPTTGGPAAAQRPPTGPQTEDEPDCYSSETRKAFVDPDRRFGDVTIKGDLIDSRKQLEHIVNIEAGKPFDLCELTFLRERFDRLGYYTRIKEEPLGSKVNVIVLLDPIEHVRHVYVRKNWPIFKDEVLRRVRYRAGTRLPPKVIRKEEFARQKRRFQEFLRKEGYFDSDADIVVEKTDRPNVVNLIIKLKKGSLYKLGKLRVQGNKAMSDDKIRSIFEHKILWWKRAFTTTRFKEDIKKLTKRYRKKGYPGVRIRHDFSPKTSLDHEKKLVNINLTVRENKRIQIHFDGNQRMAKEELRKAVTFSTEGSYDSYEMRQSARAIQRLYQTNGYFLAGVFAERVRISSREDQMVFHITEGPRLRVESIRIEGNEAYGDKTLKKKVKTRVFPKLGSIGLGSGGYISDRQLQQDVKRLRDHYKEHGYLDVKVVGDVALRPEAFDLLGVKSLDVAIQMSRKSGSAHVRFRIEEGPRYLMDSVTLKGQPDKMTTKLRKGLVLTSGAYFTRKRFSTDLERLKRQFANQGYPYCLINGTVRESDRKDSSGKKAYINIEYQFTPGVRVRFGEIFIRGNHKTARSIILRELKFKKGDIFSLAKVETARRNLRSLGIFLATRIEFIGLRAREELVHVVVKITERFDDYGQLEFGVGVSTDNLYFFSLAYRNRNLFGWGKQMELKGEAGAEIQSGRMTYKDPRFFGTRLAFDVTGFVRREDTERLGQLLTYGGSVTLLHRVTRHFQWFVRYQLQRVRRQEEIIRVAGGQDEGERVDRFTNTASLGPTVIWDRRDNPLVPSKGWKLTGSVRVATRYLAYPIQASDFVHLHFSGQGLLPLPAGIVIALGLRYDHGIPFGDSPMLPKTERFFAGGDTTVRGYEEDRLKTEVILSPLSPYGGAPRVLQVKPEGANIRMIANLELQFPIWKKSILFDMPILGVLFFDAGALVNSLEQLQADDFKTSVGAALRLVTPVGFISIEYAIPFQPSYGTDPTGRFHFNFGFIF